MTIERFLILGVIALAISVPVIIVIPRARQSTWFDRVLWLATWLLAFIGAWNVPMYLGKDFPLHAIVYINDVAMIPSIIGAAVGALTINLLLWLMDRFSQSAAEANDEPIEIPTDELPETPQEESNAENSQPQ